MRNIAQLVAFGCLTGSPAAFPKVDGSVEVRVGSIPAGAARENRLRGAIGLFSMTTLRAFTTGVARVHKNQWDSFGNALICDELFQLVKCPRMQDGTLREPSLDSVADTLEFFKHHGTIRAFSFRNYLLGNAMINVFSKASFAARLLLEKALCAVSAFLLQFSSQMTVAIANPFYLRTAEIIAVRIGKNLRYAKVAAEKIIGSFRIRRIVAENKIDIQLFGSGVKYQCASSGLAALEKVPLVVSYCQFDFDSTTNGGQTDIFRLLKKAEQVFVKVCASWLKSRRSLLSFAKTGGYTSDSTNGVVASQPVFGLDSVVAETMQSELSANVVLVRNRKNIIAGSGKSLQRKDQRLSLFSCWLEFASYCLYGFHNQNVPLTATNFKKGRCDSAAA